jgi:hypothetical protein
MLGGEWKKATIMPHKSAAEAEAEEAAGAEEKVQKGQGPSSSFPLIPIPIPISIPLFPIVHLSLPPSSIPSAGGHHIRSTTTPFPFHFPLLSPIGHCPPFIWPLAGHFTLQRRSGFISLAGHSPNPHPAFPNPNLP